MPDLRAIALNCTLKRGTELSSTDAMIAVMAAAFRDRGVTLTETIRVANHTIHPGVKTDMGDGDEWPALRKKILSHDILIFAGPIWLGQIGSLAKRVLERLDAMIHEASDDGIMASYGKVAVLGIVGNEDGAHFSTAQLCQGLNDTGWTVPPVAACYWVGEAMQSTDFKDLPQTPEKVQLTARMVAANAAHLAGLLKSAPYPPLST